MTDLLSRTTQAAKKAVVKPLTAGDVRLGMRKRWCAPEWAVMWEVNEGTGYRTGRSADAVMMSLWPSRGLELHGVEIKVSRSDFRREAADPTKAEAIAQYCDRWWLHTTPKVVDDLSALPMQWGLREFDGRAWRTIREASKLMPVPMTRHFLAALMRRAETTLQEDLRAQARKELKAEREKIAEDVEARVASALRGLDGLTERVKAFEKKTGIDLASWRSTDEHVEAFKLATALQKHGFSASKWSSVQSQVESVRTNTEALAKAIDQLATPGQETFDVRT